MSALLVVAAVLADGRASDPRSAATAWAGGPSAEGSAVAEAAPRSVRTPVTPAAVLRIDWRLLEAADAISSTVREQAFTLSRPFTGEDLQPGPDQPSPDALPPVPPEATPTPEPTPPPTPAPTVAPAVATPAATPAPVATPAAATQPAPAPVIVPGDRLYALISAAFPEDPEYAYRVAMCESSGYASINTGNGYYGLWQFDLPTWQSVGGTGLPSNASVEEQIRRARMLYEARGWQPWGCAR